MVLLYYFLIIILFVLWNWCNCFFTFKPWLNINVRKFCYGQEVIRPAAVPPWYGPSVKWRALQAGEKGGGFALTFVTFVTGNKPEVLSILPGLKWKCDDKLCLESVLHCAENNKVVIPTTGGWLFTASGVCWLTAGSAPLQCHVTCALLHLGVLLACFFYIYMHVRTHTHALTHTHTPRPGYAIHWHTIWQIQNTLFIPLGDKLNYSVHCDTGPVIHTIDKALHSCVFTSFF